MFGPLMSQTKGDIVAMLMHVRFTSSSGHHLARLACPLCAKSRHPPPHSWRFLEKLALCRIRDRSGRLTISARARVSLHWLRRLSRSEIHGVEADFLRVVELGLEIRQRNLN